MVIIIPIYQRGKLSAEKVTSSKPHHQVVGKGLESFRIADPLLATSSFFLRGSEVLVTFLCLGATAQDLLYYPSALNLPLNPTIAR